MFKLSLDSDISKTLKDAQKSVNKFTKSMESLQDSTKDYQKTTKSTASTIKDSFRKSGKSFKNFTNKTKDAFKVMLNTSQDAVKKHGKLVKDVAVSTKDYFFNSFIYREATADVVSHTEALFKMGRQLNSTRKKMQILRQDSFDKLSKSIGFTYISVDDLGKSMQGLVDSGIHSSKGAIVDLAAKMALVSKATDLSIEKLDSMSYTLTDKMGVSVRGVTDIYAKLYKVQSMVAISMEDLTKSMEDSLSGILLSYSNASEKTVKDVIGNLASISGSYGEYWGEGTKIQEILSKALSGDIDSMSKAMALTGMNMEGIQNALKSSESSAGMIKKINQNLINAVGDNATALTYQSVADLYGLDATSVRQIQKHAKAIEGTFAKVSKASAEASKDSVNYFKRLISTFTTGFKKVSVAAHNLAGYSLPLINLSLLDLYDVVADIPIASLTAIPMLLSSIWSAGSWLWTAVPHFLEVTAPYIINEVLPAISLALTGVAESLALVAAPLIGFTAPAWAVGAVVVSLGAILLYFSKDILGGLYHALVLVGSGLTTMYNWVAKDKDLSKGISDLSDTFASLWLNMKKAFHSFASIFKGSSKTYSFLNKVWKVLRKIASILVKGIIFKTIALSIKYLADILSFLVGVLDTAFVYMAKLFDLLASKKYILDAYISGGTLKALYAMGTHKDSSEQQKTPKKTLPAFATGGIVSSPTEVLVGERGAEVIAPLPDLTALVLAVADKIRPVVNVQGSKTPNNERVLIDILNTLKAISLNLGAKEVSRYSGGWQQEVPQIQGGL
jgi:hypothetical protein